MTQEKSNRTGGKEFRNVVALGFVSFFTDVSSEMCFSIFPTYIIGLPGATRAVLGIIEGLAEAFSYGLRAFSGILSDRFRHRKPIVFVGYALSNVVKPLFSIAQTSIDALIVRIGDRVGKAVRTSPRDALLSESVSENKLGSAFGLHRTLDQSGAILGPILASFLMIFIGFTLRDIFWLSFIPGLLALFILVIFVKDRVSQPKKQFKLIRGIKMVLKGKFLILLFIVGLFSIGAFNFSFVLLRAKEAGVQESFIPLVYATINVAHTAVAIPAGLLSDRIGREKVLVTGYGAFLFSTLLLLFTCQVHLYVFLVALIYGSYAGIVETIQRALVPAYAPNDLRGTAYGIYYLVVGLAFFVANTVVGSVWEYTSLAAAVSYCAATSITAIIGMIVFLRQEKH